MMGATALNQLPDLQPDHRLVLKVNSIALQEEVEKIKADLLLHLRQKLNNRRLSLHLELEEADRGKSLYTNREKLEYLAERYPKLAELRDRLGLEADF